MEYSERFAPSGDPMNKLAAAGVTSGPVGLAVNYLATITDVLQAVLLVVTILATTASGLYYFNKWRKDRE